MKPSSIQLAAAILAASIVGSMATVRYVDVNNPNPATPYTTWATAARVIQDAVDAAVEGDEIVVTNGTYATGGRAVAVCGLTLNRVALDKPVAVRSVNGPVVTIIRGRQVAGTTNGVGAVRCAYLTNGASMSGFTLTGGATETQVEEGSVDLASGGGVWCEAAVVSRCIIVGNAADGAGGGSFFGTLNNCTLIGNSAPRGGGAFCGTLNNCTIVGNSSGTSGLNAGMFVFAPCELNNCVVYHNNGTNYDEDQLTYLNNCCTTPLPMWTGAHNTSLDPRCVDEAGGDLRLQPDSPCINAGRNSYAPVGTDFDGNPRIVGGAVDIGAFEFQSPQSTLAYWWLQQYGLPTDGSADFSDDDTDGQNNWQEMRAGTSPTNALSRLQVTAMKKLRREGGGVEVTWQSVSGYSYFLERSSNLVQVPGFQTIATGIPGSSWPNGTNTTFTDTSANGAGPFFYRVGVQ